MSLQMRDPSLNAQPNFAWPGVNRAIVTQRMVEEKTRYRSDIGISRYSTIYRYRTWTWSHPYNTPLTSTNTLLIVQKSKTCMSRRPVVMWSSPGGHIELAYDNNYNNNYYLQQKIAVVFTNQKSSLLLCARLICATKSNKSYTSE